MDCPVQKGSRTIPLGAAALALASSSSDQLRLLQARGFPIRGIVAHAIASRVARARMVAHPAVTLEAAGKATEATAVVAEGADRDELWERHVAAHPEFASYPEKTGGRVIPIIRLTPIA